MAEGGGGGEAGEEGPRAVGPRPPSARDLQVRRAAGRGRGVEDGAAGGVWNRPGRGRASPDRLGDRTVIPAPRVRPRRRAGQRRRWKQVSEPGCQWCPCLVSPPPHLQFKKQLLMSNGVWGVRGQLSASPVDAPVRLTAEESSAVAWGSRVTAWAGLILSVLDAVCGSITYV